jgi:protein-disulfide isomerase
LGLDISLFNACLESGKYLQSVAGVSHGIVVPATPTIFINGRMVTGVAPLDTYARIISEELEAN